MATKVSEGRYKTTVYLGLDELGKRKQKAFYAPTADEADFLALEYKLKKRQEEDPLQMTLRKGIEYYIASKDAILSPTTIQGYRICLNNRFQALMEEQLKDIDSKRLQEAINREAKLISERGRKISVKTLKNAASLVISTVNYFFPDKRIRVKFPQQKNVQYATPNGEALQRIFEATKGTSIEIPVLLAAWLSLRASEICGLKWSDVHDDYIEINEAKVYANKQQYSKAPKTESSNRKIPLPKYIKDVLDQQERKGIYVTEMTGQAIYKKFVTVLAERGLPHCRFHDLRHANASIMLQLGIPDKYAQKRGGWASEKVLKKVYQQTFEEEEIKVAKQIDQYFDTLIHTDIHTK